MKQAQQLSARVKELQAKQQIGQPASPLIFEPESQLTIERPRPGAVTATWVHSSVWQHSGANSSNLIAHEILGPDGKLWSTQSSANPANRGPQRFCWDFPAEFPGILAKHRLSRLKFTRKVDPVPDEVTTTKPNEALSRTRTRLRSRAHAGMGPRRTRLPSAKPLLTAGNAEPSPEPDPDAPACVEHTPQWVHAMQSLPPGELPELSDMASASDSDSDDGASFSSGGGCAHAVAAVLALR